MYYFYVMEPRFLNSFKFTNSILRPMRRVFIFAMYFIKAGVGEAVLKCQATSFSKLKSS